MLGLQLSPPDPEKHSRLPFRTDTTKVNHRTSLDDGGGEPKRKFESVESSADHQNFQGRTATNSLESGGNAW